MTESPYGIVTYCDDIRMELGGKLTLVGCYTGEMTVYGVTPLALPTFCAFVNFRVPIETDFNKIEIKLLHDVGGASKLLAAADFQSPSAEMEVETLEKKVGQHVSINFPIKLSPLLIDGEGFVRCRAYIDEIEYKLGSLRIVISDPSNMDPSLSPFTPAAS